jgi:predicted PurR-regulated permease PerM
MEEKIEKLENEIRAIKARNVLVEMDKAWEQSWTRKIIVAIFTYLAISIYMWAVKIDRPFLNAIVPTVGFLLSTLTLPLFKKIWQGRRKK